MKRFPLLLVAAVFMGCGSAPEPEKKAAVPPPAAPVAAVKDHSAAMPPEGLKSAEVVPNHILGKPEMPGSMLWPLLSMFLGFMLFYGAVLCMRLRGEVLNRERQSAWVREAVKS